MKPVLSLGVAFSTAAALTFGAALSGCTSLQSYKEVSPEVREKMVACYTSELGKDHSRDIAQLRPGLDALFDGASQMGRRHWNTIANDALNEHLSKSICAGPLNIDEQSLPMPFPEPVTTSQAQAPAHK